MKDFPNILYSLLRQRGMTQKMLADKAHTTEATISRYLTDTKRMPRADLIVSIAEALDVSTDYLLYLLRWKNCFPATPKHQKVIVRLSGRFWTNIRLLISR